MRDKRTNEPKKKQQPNDIRRIWKNTLFAQSVFDRRFCLDCSKKPYSSTEPKPSKWNKYNKNKRERLANRKHWPVFRPISERKSGQSQIQIGLVRVIAGLLPRISVKKSEANRIIACFTWWLIHSTPYRPTEEEEIEGKRRWKGEMGKMSQELNFTAHIPIFLHACFSAGARALEYKPPIRSTFSWKLTLKLKPMWRHSYILDLCFVLIALAALHAKLCKLLDIFFALFFVGKRLRPC